MHGRVYLRPGSGHLGQRSELEKDFEEGMLVLLADRAGGVDQVGSHFQSAVQHFLVVAVQKVRRDYQLDQTLHERIQLRGKFHCRVGQYR